MWLPIQSIFKENTDARAKIRFGAKTTVSSLSRDIYSDRLKGNINKV